MSDTGSTKFPEGPKPAGSSPIGKNETVLSARLIGVPNATKGAADKVLKLQGQVIDQSDQGRVRVQTPKGVVEIQLPKDAPQGREPLERGQRVEINIPPERVRKRNPESVQIKAEIPPEIAAKAQAKAQRIEAQNTQETLATSTANGQAEQPKAQSVDEKTAAPPRTTQETAKHTAQQARLDANLTQQLRDILPPKETLTKALPLRSLEGETIRLTPLPPHLTSQITVPDVTTIQTSATSQTNTTQSIVIPSAALETGPLPQAPLVISPPTAQTEKPLITQPDTSAKTILNQSLTAQSASDFITIALPDAKAPTPTTNTIQNINLTQQPLVNTGTLKTANTFITFEPLKTLPNTQRAITIAPITANIQSIKPPELVLNAPVIQTENTASLPNAPAPDTVKITPNTQNNTILNTLPTGTQTATIIGSAGRQLPVVQIPSTIANGFSQNFILQAPVQDAVVGTRMEILPQSTMQSGAQVSAASTFSLALPPASYFLIPDQWPLMDDILQSLRSASAPTAQAFISMMPNAANAPSQMGPAALFIMAALRGGDLSNILSEKAQDILKASGKGGLINRLTQEGGIINRLSADTPSTDWRSLTLPMAWENEIHKVALHYKHNHPGSEDDNKGDKQTRFIFDLSLTRMGKVQIDGLHKQDRLNLIIRTEQPLSRAMQMTMKDGYIGALEETSLKGDLSFQNNLDNWVKISAKNEDQFAADI